MKIVTNTNCKELLDLAKVCLDNKLYVGDKWLLKRALSQLITGELDTYLIRIWVAYIDDKPVGMACYDGVSLSLQFYVKCEYRRQGIGGRLFQEIELDKTIQAFKVLQGSINSFKFYAKLGFTPNIVDIRTCPDIIKKRWQDRKIKNWLKKWTPK